ncbi:MAG: class I SAM-dependent methyltransferase [Pseudomonadota bacterium]
MSSAARCRICQSDLDTEAIIGREIWSFSDKRFEYYECLSCGCIQIRDYPDDIGDYYSDEYYSFNVERKMSALKGWLINKRDIYALSRKGILGGLLCRIWPTNLFKSIPYPAVNRSSKILDVGCGDGSFLLNLHHLGFTNLTGIDPFLTKEYAIGDQLSIERKDIYQIEERFDCVVLKGTLEHQPNQLKLLEKIGDVLSPGGLCVIRIPVCDSYAWEHYRENWVQFDAPRHFYLHTVRSMKHLASAANFSIHHMEDDSDVLQFTGSEQLLVDIALHDPRSHLVNPKASIFSPAQLKAFSTKRDELDKSRKGDVMIFILKKEDASG